MIEELSRRTLHGRTYRLPSPNAFRTELSATTIHIPMNPAAWRRGEPVQFEEPDLAFDSVTNAFQLRRAWFQLQVPTTGAIGYHYQSRVTEGGEVFVRLLQLDGRAVPSITPRLDQSRIWWDNVRPELSLYLDISVGKVEIWKRLSGPAAPRQLLWEVIERLPSVLPLTLQTRGHDNADFLDVTRVGLGPGLARRRVRLLHAIGPDDLVSMPGFRVFTVLETWTGETFLRDAQRRFTPTFDVSYPVLIDQDITETIQAADDDGYEDNATWFNQYNASGDHLWDTNFGTRGGYRFQTVDVPNAATIDAATLQVNVPGFSGTTVSHIIGGVDDTDDTVAWTTATRPSTRTLTTARSGTLALTGTGNFSISVTSVIQEIINRAGWVSGNNLSVCGDADAGGNPNTYAYVNDRDGGTANVAQLTIDYTAGAVGSLIAPWWMSPALLSR